jgi:hypothetical protein
MRYFTSQNIISAISRQSYTNGKSAFASVGTGTGYIKPLSEQEASFSGVQYGHGFTLIVETDVDIKEGDKITVDSINYMVRGVVNHNRGGITAYKRCLLTKDMI